LFIHGIYALEVVQNFLDFRIYLPRSVPSDLHRPSVRESDSCSAAAAHIPLRPPNPLQSPIAVDRQYLLVERPSNFATDPLSVAASVVGLLTAAGKMAQLLKGLTDLVDAPGSATAVMTEMNTMTGALQHLSDYLNGALSVPAGREQLVLLEHEAATLVGCVATYSELEAIIDSVHGGAEMGVVDCIKWTLKETEIRDIIQRIQNHKSSLTLMLSILQW
jgi:hypothetical protein